MEFGIVFMWMIAAVIIIMSLFREKEAEEIIKKRSLGYKKDPMKSYTEGTQFIYKIKK